MIMCLHYGVKEVDQDRMKTLLRKHMAIFPSCSYCIAARKLEVCLPTAKKHAAKKVTLIEKMMNKEIEVEPICLDRGEGVSFNVVTNEQAATSKKHGTVTAWLKSNDNICAIYEDEDLPG